MLRALVSAPLTVAIALVPLYLWDSGGVQVAHLIFLIFILGVAATWKIRVDQGEKLLLVLFLWILLREASAIFGGASIKSMLPVAQMAFSFILFSATKRYAEISDNSAPVVRGLYVATFIALGGIFLLGYGTGPDETLRAVGTFNNPNQLGYFCVCLLAMAYACRLANQISVGWMIPLVAASFLLATLALSKAALVSITFGLLGFGFSTSASRKTIFRGLVAFTFLFAIGIVLYKQGALDDYAFVQRLQGIGTQSDDTLEARGYLSLTGYGASEFLWGHGYEGGLVEIGHEVHSTIFSFFVGYGAIGGAIFVGFLCWWAIRLWRGFGPVGVYLVFAPVMLYGITHNGSRFSIFWALVGISAGLAAAATKKLRPMRR